MGGVEGKQKTLLDIGPAGSSRGGSGRSGRNLNRRPEEKGMQSRFFTAQTDGGLGFRFDPMDSKFSDLGLVTEEDGYNWQTEFYIDKPIRQIMERVVRSDYWEELIRICGERKRWEERASGLCVLCDLSISGKPLVLFNPEEKKLVPVAVHSLKELHEVMGKARVKFAGLVLAAPDLRKEDGLGLTEILNSTSGILNRYESPLLIMEERGGDRDTGWRKDLLENAGYVDRRVLVSEQISRNHLIWEARRPKMHERHRINLLEPKAGWTLTKDYLAAVAWGIERLYRDGGYEVVDWSELIEHMSSSSFPPLDMSSFRNGFGVEIVPSETDHNCTARWKVDWQGNWQRIVDCAEFGCEGHAVEMRGYMIESDYGMVNREKYPWEPGAYRIVGGHDRKGRMEMFDLVKGKDLGRPCNNCGNMIRESYRVQEILPSGRVKLLVSTGCGCRFPEEEFITVSPDQVMGNYSRR